MLVVIREGKRKRECRSDCLRHLLSIASYVLAVVLSIWIAEDGPEFLSTQPSTKHVRRDAGGYESEHLLGENARQLRITNNWLISEQLSFAGVAGVRER